MFPECECLGWYEEFFLKIALQFLLGQTSARLNLKIMPNSLHTGPGIRILTVVWYSMVQTRQWADGLELNSDHGMNNGQFKCQTQIPENSAIQVTTVQ